MSQVLCTSKNDPDLEDELELARFEWTNMRWVLRMSQVLTALPMQIVLLKVNFNGVIYEIVL